MIQFAKLISKLNIIPFLSYIKVIKGTYNEEENYYNSTYIILLAINSFTIVN